MTIDVRLMMIRHWGLLERAIDAIIPMSEQFAILPVAVVGYDGPRGGYLYFAQTALHLLTDPEGEKQSVSTVELRHVINLESSQPDGALQIAAFRPGWPFDGVPIHPYPNRLTAHVVLGMRREVRRAGGQVTGNGWETWENYRHEFREKESD